jgi:hypothetical protein
MINSENSIDYWLSEMVRKGSAGADNLWIEQAVRQRNSRISIGVASSIAIVYDQIDRRLASQSNLN